MARCRSHAHALAGAMLLLAGLTMASAPVRAANDDPGKGLKPLAYRPLPLGAIRPEGWLKAQLQTQAQGLSGHLDEFWPDIRNSAWTGGDAEGWERAPYWLDGVVPLAYLLSDDALKARTKSFIDYVLNHQHDDGWLGPVSDGKHPPYDPWPLFVLFKALTQYQEATGDARVVPAMTRCLHKMDEVIGKQPLTSWARFRAADLIVSVFWLYDRTQDPWLLAFARKVDAQAFDWGKLYANFPYKGRTQGKFDMDTHGVNTGMGWKQPGVRFRLTGDDRDRDAVFRMLSELDRDHGQATGMFTCDEHLAGRSPSQGTELCTVVEAMYSLENLLGILGAPELGDRLERIAFNALPATFKPDMTAHQYDQQANQVVCKLAPDHVYVNNGPDSNLYGLEPNFGCCTANMHQGWPKLAANLVMAAPDGGLAVVAYAPCEVKTKVDDQPVTLSLKTSYPFRDTVTVEVETDARLPVHLRIPTWAEGATLTVGKDDPRPVRAGSFEILTRDWKGKDTAMTLKLPMRVRLREGFHKSVSIERGPLVYALRIGTHWKKLKDNAQFADWEVFPTTFWNYALQVDREHTERSVAFEVRPMGDRPFSPTEPAVVAHVRGRLLPSWTIEKNAAAPPPESPVLSDQPLEDLLLVPYGNTSLRVTEFPTLSDP